MIILGIDPGSRCTGFGLIDNQPNRITYMHSGFFKIRGESLPQRLGQIYQHIDELIRQYQPQQMSIEQVFMHRNADSALKLGQARGAAICAGHMAGLEIIEYAAREGFQDMQLAQVFGTPNNDRARVARGDEERAIELYNSSWRSGTPATPPVGSSA